MMRSILATFVGCIATLSFLLWSFPSATAADISGRVFNGTGGAPLPENLEVVVFAIENNTGEIMERRSNLASSDGTFLFTDVADGANIAYRVVALRENYSPFIDIPPGSATSDLTVTIWESNTDPDILRLANYNLLAAAVDGSERRIAFLTSLVIRNDTDTVWVTKPPTEGLTGPDLLRFNLPEGYENLSVETSLPSGNVLEIGTGFALTTPVPPGEHAVIVSYNITYDGTEFIAPFRLPHGADSLSVLLPEGAGQVQGEGIGFGGEVEVPIGENTVIFNSYSGSSYTPGAAVNLRVSGLPEPPLIQRIANSLVGMGYIIGISVTLGVALISLITFAALRRRHELKAAGVSVSADLADLDESERSRRETVRLIAELDELKADGDLSDEDYLSRRAALINLALKADQKTELQ